MIINWGSGAIFSYVGRRSATIISAGRPVSATVVVADSSSVSGGIAMVAMVPTGMVRRTWKTERAKPKPKPTRKRQRRGGEDDDATVAAVPRISVVRTAPAPVVMTEEDEWLLDLVELEEVA